MNGLLTLPQLTRRIVYGVKVALAMLEPVSLFRRLLDEGVKPLLSIGKTVVGLFFDTSEIVALDSMHWTLRSFTMEDQHWKLHFPDYREYTEEEPTVGLGTTLHYAGGHWILARVSKQAVDCKRPEAARLVYRLTHRKGLNLKAFLERFSPKLVREPVPRVHKYSTESLGSSTTNLKCCTAGSFIEKEIEAEVFSRLDHFYKEGESERFAKLGQPHRLVFLFHGPPGTGKTRFVSDLAYKYKRALNVYPVGKDLVRSTAFLVMERCTSPNSMHLFDEIEKGVVTSESSLAKLCVALDGEGAPEGAVIFLIANDIKSLPECLLRSRRVHCAVKFGEFSADLLARAFNYWAKVFEIEEEVSPAELKSYHKKLVGAKVIEVLDDLVREERLGRDAYLEALEKVVNERPAPGRVRE